MTYTEQQLTTAIVSQASPLAEYELKKYERSNILDTATAIWYCNSNERSNILDTLILYCLTKYFLAVACQVTTTRRYWRQANQLLTGLLLLQLLTGLLLLQPMI
jgi:hypothetical protein